MSRSEMSVVLEYTERNSTSLCTQDVMSGRETAAHEFPKPRHAVRVWSRDQQPMGRLGWSLQEEPFLQAKGGVLELRRKKWCVLDPHIFTFGRGVGSLLDGQAEMGPIVCGTWHFFAQGSWCPLWSCQIFTSKYWTALTVIYFVTVVMLKSSTNAQINFP